MFWISEWFYFNVLGLASSTYYPRFSERDVNDVISLTNLNSSCDSISMPSLEVIYIYDTEISSILPKK